MRFVRTIQDMSHLHDFIGVTGPRKFLTSVNGPFPRHDLTKNVDAWLLFSPISKFLARRLAVHQLRSKTNCGLRNFLFSVFQGIVFHLTNPTLT